MNGQDHTNFWELITGNLFNENDKEEEKKLEELLREEENQKQFNQANDIHIKLPHTLSLHEFSHTRSWNRINQYLHRKKIRLFIAATKYAAIIVLAFAIGALVDWDLKPQNEPQLLAEITVPPGQMSNITLYDGTQVWLNSGTTLKYASDFGESSRKVSLDGEAYFKVKKGEIPFKVQLKTSEIEVLGTSFNAVSFSNENFSQVTLVEGSVKLNSLHGKAIGQMQPSQQMTLSDDLQDVHLKTVDTGFYQSWTEGKIVFREERLADIASRLERWYNVEIRLTTPEIGELRFSGTILKNKPFDQIAKAFELLLPVKINYKNNMNEKDVVIISKK